MDRMDREIAPSIRQRRLTRNIVVSLVAVAGIAFFLASTLEWLRPSVKRGEIRTARVARGAVDATLQASGTIVPAGEKVISSPVEARVLRIVRRAGDRVRRGDEILTLDTSASKLDVDRIDERLAQKESERTQLRLRLDESSESLRAQIASKKLDVEILRHRAMQTQRMAREGLTAEQDDLAAQASAKKAEIELAQLEAALTRAKRSAEAQLAGAEMAVNILRRERDESRRQLDLAMTRADRDGVVTWVIAEEGATVRRGDVVARVADLSAFRLVGTVSDMHVSRIAAGMPVVVRIDDVDLAGTISAVDPRIENGTARFHVELAERAHPKLRSNVRVDVFVVTGRRTGVLALERGALAGTQREEVFVVRGERAVRTTALFGIAGQESLEVVGGLVEGDEVVISDMNEYREVRELRIK